MEARCQDRKRPVTNCNTGRPQPRSGEERGEGLADGAVADQFPQPARESRSRRMATHGRPVTACTANSRPPPGSGTLTRGEERSNRRSSMPPLPHEQPLPRSTGPRLAGGSAWPWWWPSPWWWRACWVGDGLPGCGRLAAWLGERHGRDLRGAVRLRAWACPRGRCRARLRGRGGADGGVEVSSGS